MKIIIEYLNNLFNIDNETSATIVITLTVFILGFIITWFINVLRKYFNRRRTRKLFLDLLKEIARTTLRQSNNFFDFSKKLTIENQDIFELDKSPINHLDNISRLSINSFHEAFFTGPENLCCRIIKQKAFNKIWIHISALSYWEQQYPNDLKEFINKFNNYEDKRNEELENWRKLSDELIFQVRQQGPTGRYLEYFTRYDEIVYGWQTAGQNTHYFTVQTDLIEPLRLLNRDFHDLPVVLVLNNPLLGVTNYYENLISTLRVYNRQFNSLGISYKNSSKMITKGLQILK